MLAHRVEGERVPSSVLTHRILDLLATARHADPRVPLVVRGEPGVGKDTLARLVHEASARSREPFIKVECAGRSSERHEAELFGHETGASALARGRRPGSFEFANHGTLYVDEIGALECGVVPKLLKALRTGEVTRIGDERPIVVDVRLIVSTAHAVAALHDELWEGLRSLHAVELWIPPLRQRPHEILDLASFFVDRLNRQYRQQLQLWPEVIASLQADSWPGNVRELEDAVLRLVFGRDAAPVH